MGKPQLSEYLLPILKSFTIKSELTRSEIVDILTENYNLVQVDAPKRSFLLINTCLGYFLKSKVLERTANKSFKITERGMEIINSNIEQLNVQYLRKFSEFNEFILSRYSKKTNYNGTINSVETIDDELPEDKIETIYELYKKNLSLEILDNVKKSSWQFFEVLVVDLLVAMGYGDPYDEGRITRGNSDGGIDGIIKADVLGLDTICIQAKKWEGTVGRPEIQKFTGSLESLKAKKGVFITTSSFSNEAKEYVNSIEKKVILIDGEKLAELMIDYNIGVSTHKKIFIKKIDTDYFDGN